MVTIIQATSGFPGLKELTRFREPTLMMANIRDEGLDALEAALPDARMHNATGGGVSRVRNLKCEQQPLSGSVLSQVKTGSTWKALAR